jgi:hypothetical protein
MCEDCLRNLSSIFSILNSDEPKTLGYLIVPSDYFKFQGVRTGIVLFAIVPCRTGINQVFTDAIYIDSDKRIGNFI